MRQTLKKKMRIIFYIAMENDHDCVVLSALGCGAYKNPPKHIAMLFKEVLEEDAFRGKFKKVIFSIIDDGNTGKEHNPRGNIIPFKEVFDKKHDCQKFYPAEQTRFPSPEKIISIIVFEVGSSLNGVTSYVSLSASGKYLDYFIAYC